MAFSGNLLSMVQGYVTPDLIKKSGSYIGLNPDKTQSGFEAAIPAVLMGLVHKGSTAEGANKILDLVQEDEYDTGVPGNFQDHFKGGKATENYFHKGYDAVRGIFGNHLDSVTERLSATTGLHPTGITKMLGLVAPIALGALGSKVRENGLNASSLSGFLGQQRGSLEGLVPGGLFGGERRAADVASIRRPDLVENPMVDRRPSDRYEMDGLTPAATRKASWVPLALLGLLVLGGIWMLRSRHQVDRAKNAEQDRAARIAERPAPPAPPPGAPVPPPPKAGDQLSAFLSSGSDSELPKKFTYPDLKFDSNSARLSPESSRTLDRIADALKAHPDAEAKIESYADGKGSSDANRTLSAQRAESVKDGLVERGVKDAQLTAEGKGSPNPIAPNSTEEGRLENRRTEILITQR